MNENVEKKNYNNFLIKYNGSYEKEMEMNYGCQRFFDKICTNFRAKIGFNSPCVTKTNFGLGNIHRSISLNV